jgi:hypothetical protein
LCRPIGWLRLVVATTGSRRDDNAVREVVRWSTEAAVVLGNASASQAPAPTSQAPAPVEAPAPALVPMPDVVGMNLQDAQDLIQTEGIFCR